MAATIERRFNQYYQPQKPVTLKPRDIKNGITPGDYIELWIQFINYDTQTMLNPLTRRWVQKKGVTYKRLEKLYIDCKTYCFFNGNFTSAMIKAFPHYFITRIQTPEEYILLIPY